jgi:hypothetical protein
MFRAKAAALCIALIACAPTAAGDLSSHIAIARQYVTAAEMVANSCILSGLPICQKVEVQQAIAQAQRVAEEALTEAENYAKAGSDAERVQTLLRVAMNAVLMFYTYK